MAAPEATDDRSAQRGDPQRRAIHAAAITQFSERGFSGTSMTNIADAAGMSRPALYQYFRNKGDIFSSAFIALIEEHVDLALAALDGAGTAEYQLDRFLQRFEGDLWEHMAASPHSEEIMSAKNGEVIAGFKVAAERLWGGCADYLDRVAPTVEPEQRSDWVDLLHYAPKGFKFDTPTVAVYRRRLAALARGVAADIASDDV